MKSVPEAIEEILASVPLLGTERVLLLDAPGRVLAEPLVSGRVIPPLDNSAMDGYAVRAADTAGASENSPKALRLAGEVPAGALPRAPVGAGEAVRVTTGAPLPAGADAVVMQENVREGRAGHVEILAAAQPKENVRFKGEDIQAGERVLEPGTVLGPSQVALLAMLGRSVVEVRRRPLVAILSSGDELVGIDGDTEGWRTVDSNAYAAAAQVRDAGGVPLLLPIAPDRREAIRERLEGARGADALVSTAGVSVGPRDFVKAALDDLGFDLKFWRVRQRPGSPLAYGLWQGRPVFGLPGNPVSAAVCFEIYARTALRQMQGFSRIFRSVVRARLEGAVRTKPSHTYFLRGHLARAASGEWAARPAGAQGSAALKALAQGNALLVVPEGAPTPQSGADVAALALDPAALDLAGGEIGPALGFKGT